MSSPSCPSAKRDPTAAHSDVTLALAKKESAEHLGKEMTELYQNMRKRNLKISAFHVDDPNAPPSEGKNVKTVHFVRHGQGFHNLLADMARADGREWTQYIPTPSNPYVIPELLDSPLTEKGRRQAAILQPTVKSLNPQPQLIVLSPNCRALQTGVIVFQDLISTGIQFVAHEMVREEQGVHICDKRRPKSSQAMEFPQVDFSLLEDEEDMLFRDDRRETKMEIGERIYTFLEWLERRNEKNVGIVSHSGWLMTIFNGVLECDEGLKPWFQTGEMRSVKLLFERD
mmetsp:Transcript_19852/g.24496  ORF Transcript_19852/g.24496 Transcript_19852/m.24496 type:complete len:285 (+) Transcript_19852:147-1001(+)